MSSEETASLLVEAPPDPRKSRKALQFFHGRARKCKTFFGGTVAIAFVFSTLYMFTSSIVFDKMFLDRFSGLAKYHFSYNNTYTIPQQPELKTFKQKTGHEHVSVTKKTEDSDYYVYQSDKSAEDQEAEYENDEFDKVSTDTENERFNDYGVLESDNSVKNKKITTDITENHPPDSDLDFNFEHWTKKALQDIKDITKLPVSSDMSAFTTGFNSRSSTISSSEEELIETTTQADITSESLEERYEAIFSTDIRSGSPEKYVAISSTEITPESLEENEAISSTSSIGALEGSSSTTVSYKSTTTTSPTTTLEPIKMELGCRVPKLDPFDPSLVDLINKKTLEPQCDKFLYRVLFETDRNSQLLWYKGKDPAEKGWKDCCYRKVTRIGLNNDNKQRVEKKCHPTKQYITEIPQSMEYIAVYCNRDDDKINPNGLETMVDVFAFAPSKPKVEKRIADFQKKHKSWRPEDKVNLVIFGIDATSHMNFQRAMPQVVKYLKNNLSAIWMDGYSKIGENTYPNVAAMLTSWNLTEIDNGCKEQMFFDGCPFIWKNFSQNGYRTSFAEDETGMATFNYLKGGFRKPPVDYYLRPIANIAGKHIRNDRRGNTNLCYGPRLGFYFLTKYLETVAKRMGKDKRYFQFTWTSSLTHDYLALAKYGEPALLSTIKWLHANGYLNHTVLVLTSDHGDRYGKIRKRRQGKIEENMPFLYFIFPTWFRLKYKKAIRNLISNRGQLTTPFDAYETFKDILFLERISSKSIKTRQKSLPEEGNVSDENGNGGIPRGISLFIKIPQFRNCPMAGIAEHWCICHATKNISSKTPAVAQGTNFAIFQMNSYVANYSNCAYLGLSKIIRAEKVEVQNNKIGNLDQIFDLTFSTLPGNGEFEATVIKSVKDGWSLSGTISRINMYGNQSYCVDQNELKKFCYCLL